jgi:phosphatidylglycerol:prolipoprotein diacylglycerol transferase
MNFPVYVEVFGARVHPHLLMELLGYAGGFQLYLWLRRREARRAPGDVPEAVASMWVIVGCIFGAFVGSKVLAWAESWQHYWAHRGDPRVWAGGKTIVGGLLGGWVGVEIAKKFVGIRRSTGDLFVFPLILGMCLGRVGCFLTGLEDRTHGVATGLPWGVDFGDGVRRHPAQLYEIGFLVLLGVLLWVMWRRREWGDGRMFRWFLVGYLGFRFAVEFIKPVIRSPGVNLSAIQVASVLGVVACAVSLLRGRREGGHG